MTDRIRNVLARKGDHVVTVAPEATVFGAIERMNEHRIGSVLVVDTYRPGRPYRPIGIFTERDVLMRVIAQGLDPHATRVDAVMTPDPVIVYATETVEAAMRIVTERRCRHLPVVDETGLCGLVSIGDLMKWVVGDQRRTIEDLHAYIQRA